MKASIYKWKIRGIWLLKVLKSTGSKKEYRFISSKFTNTRLMGVVGLVNTWDLMIDGKKEKEVKQIFHLDFEEYGIDGYDLIDSNDRDNYNKTLMYVTGGLGGDFVKISYEEMNAILFDCFNVCKEAAYDYKDLIDDFGFLLFNSDESYRESYFEKSSVEMTCDYEVINYYLMRIAGKDKLAISYLSKSLDPVSISKLPSTLIRNDIYELDKSKDLSRYELKSLIDNTDGYRFVHSIISIDEDLLVRDFKITDIREATSVEAAMNLRKKEHIAVSYVDELNFESIFEEYMPHTMCNYHERGQLYIEFNKDNHHVRDKIYYLSSDIYCMYYYTDESQLVITSFEKENLDKSIEKLKDVFGHMINVNSSFTADIPIIYEFVNSRFGDFYSFLE